MGRRIRSCRHRPGRASSCARLQATPVGMKRCCRGQHRIGLRLAANAPQQAFGLQARAGAGGAFRVAAVLGQQHADVHLVGLGLQVLEEAPDAVPLLVPLALPSRASLRSPSASAPRSACTRACRAECLRPRRGASGRPGISFQAGVWMGLMAPVRSVSLSLGITRPSPRQSRGQNPGRRRRRPRRS